MTSRAETSGADTARERRMPPVELLMYLQQLTKSAATPPVMLVLRLNRSDQLRALAQDPDSTGVLREVVRRIEEKLRPRDRYCLAAIDELWIVLAELQTEAVAKLAAAALRDALGLPVSVEHKGRPLHTVQLRPAIGLASPSDRSGNAMALLQAASDACASAHTAEDRIEAAKAGADQELANRARIEVDLRRALFANELEVHFQPQVRLADRRCVGVEALIRWPRPAGQQPVAPALIASICEERGMMPQLTHFVLNTSLRTMMLWQARGLQLGVAINLSALTLADPSFPDAVAQACATWGISPQRLTLELTEGSIIQNERVAIAFMHRLRELGCELSIDDFGTGYSSFAYLRQLPVNELKIDRLFVRNLATDVGDQRIVQALVDLSRGFKLRSLAEGAELPETVAALQRAGCDYVQGYFFSRPQPADALTEWVQSFHASSAEQPVSA
ncbi:MAG TPA: EAL domain-containing protein [Burkholderiaceae bacterium]|nr:EAL domain-containing protein [Burkholderiaceae bacterium]